MRSRRRSRTCSRTCSRRRHWARRSCRSSPSCCSRGARSEAFRLASSLFWLILIVTRLADGAVHGRRRDRDPAVHGHPGPFADGLTTGLSRVLFPVVLLLSLTGLMVAILQSYDQFSVAAIAPAVWNVVIIVGMVVLHAQFHGQNQVYSYAVAWLVATIVQMLLVWWAMRRTEFRFSFDAGLARPAGSPGAAAVLPGDAVDRDHQPRHLHQRRVRGARLAGRAGRDQRRVPDLHAPAGGLLGRGRDGPVPDAQPDGVGAQPAAGCGTRSATGSGRST